MPSIASRSAKRQQLCLSYFDARFSFQELNVRVPGKGLELLSANRGKFEIYQLLFTDERALVVDSVKKLCRLVSEFGRVCERRKLRVNVGKCKVMRYLAQGMKVGVECM